ncbi:hypothetical protein CH381_30000, partial [Leptospira sp. mixed culture ATI2-C-A1]
QKRVIRNFFLVVTGRDRKHGNSQSKQQEFRFQIKTINEKLPKYISIFQFSNLYFYLFHWVSVMLLFNFDFNEPNKITSVWFLVYF